MNHQVIRELIKTDSRKALQELYEAYGSKFYNYGITKWRLSEDACWDVIYQTLETVITKLPDAFESQKHFENWMYKVFINFLRMHFRSHRGDKFKILSFDANYAENIEDEGDNNSELINEIEEDEDQEEIVAEWELDIESLQQYYKNESVENPLMSALKEELGKLPAEDKDLLLLRAQNFSYDEIAAFLNIENKQLKVKFLRLKNKLKKKLNNKLPINKRHIQKLT